MLRMIEQRWNYKGHLCHISIEDEYEDDVSKAFHFIVKPSGEQVLAPLDSYDCTKKLVEDWIDLNYPNRIGIAPLNEGDMLLLKETSGRS